MVAKKKIHKLAFEFESDFTLIGIASHENDYRLSWAINKSLNFELVKHNDLTINHPKHKIDINYSVYDFTDEDNYVSYHLISNKSDRGFLIPEMKNIDFILRISGTQDTILLNKILAKLKRIDIIITAFFIDNISEKISKIFVF